MFETDDRGRVVALMLPESAKFQPAALASLQSLRALEMFFMPQLQVDATLARLIGAMPSLRQLTRYERTLGSIGPSLGGSARRERKPTRSLTYIQTLLQIADRKAPLGAVRCSQ